MDQVGLMLSVATIMTRLQNMSADDGKAIMRNLDSYKSDVVDMLEKGWTSDEIVSILKLTEGVNPDIDEDVAMGRMAKITEQVNKRLSGG